jgi:hypothetical protein
MRWAVIPVDAKQPIQFEENPDEEAIDYAIGDEFIGRIRFVDPGPLGMRFYYDGELGSALPPNLKATEICGVELRGPVVVTGGLDSIGKDRSLNDIKVQYLKDWDSTKEDS